MRDCFTELIEERLPDTDVVALGVPGYGTAQDLLAYGRLGSRFSPDLVMLVFVPNDPAENLDEPAQGRPAGGPSLHAVAAGTGGRGLRAYRGPAATSEGRRIAGRRLPARGPGFPEPGGSATTGLDLRRCGIAVPCSAPASGAGGGRRPEADARRDPHFSPEGHRVVAEAIVEHLLGAPALCPAAARPPGPRPPGPR
jgi:hypothetical protein